MNSLQQNVIMARVEQMAYRARREVALMAQAARRSIGQSIRRSRERIAAITNGGKK